MLIFLGALSILAGVRFDQAYYSASWQGEEESFISLGVYLHSDGDFLWRRFAIEERIRIEYGRIYREGEDVSISGDKLEGELIGRVITGWIGEPYASLRCLTSIKKDTILFNPLELFQSIGLYRDFFSRLFNVRLGFTFKETFDRRESSIPVDGGFEIFLGFMKDFSRTRLKSEMRLFKPLFSSLGDEVDYPVVDLLTLISLKPWKYMDINLNIEVRYDKKEVSKVQLKEALYLGFSLNL